MQCNSRLSQLFCQRAVLLSTELYTTMDCARLCCAGLRSRLSTVLRCTGLDCAVCTAVECDVSTCIRISTVLYDGCWMCCIQLSTVLYSSRSSVLYISIVCADSRLSTVLFTTLDCVVCAIQGSTMLFFLPVQVLGLDCAVYGFPLRCTGLDCAVYR